ncbi:MAG: oligosaccharide flippase family protein [Verrucomicrobiae bacterium]|nr:oligosaccharide flippase family protein [Verrucomicrobiae bacterium]
MDRTRYHHILRSTVFSGGSQVVSAVAALVRTKIAAVCVGVGGIGMLGLYTQAAHLISAIAEMGLTASAVREVAVARGTRDTLRLAQVIRSLRMLVLATGVVAAAVCMLLASWLSRLTFGDNSHQIGFLFVGGALFLNQLAAGQTALLRGLGHIRELALQRAMVAVVATVAAGCCYLIWGINGIAPSLLVIGGVTLAGSWWYARRVNVEPVKLGWREVLAHARRFLGMGLAFMWVSLASLGVAYLIGIMIRRELGVLGNGIYQAAWGISGYFVGFVLNAMGEDFYPRLTGVIQNHEEAGALLNAQTEMGILLGLPGMVATSACATWAVSLMFSPEFSGAAGAVAWFNLGCFGRVVSWPFSFVLMARGDSFLYAGTVGLFAVVNLLFAWIGLRLHGVTGVALGFAAMHVCNFFTLRVIIGRMLVFSYAPAVRRLILLGSGCLIVAPFIGPWCGMGLALTLGCLSLRSLASRLGPDHRLVGHARKFPPVRWLIDVRLPT